MWHRHERPSSTFRVRTTPTCHPERKHKGHGLCRRCYQIKHGPEQDLRRRFGLDLTRYATLLEQQGGVCAICKEPETFVRNGRLYSLAVDHNHACCPGRKSCGKCIRGLLCRRCNTMLGLYEDDPNAIVNVLSQAVIYLKEGGELGRPGMAR